MQKCVKIYTEIIIVIREPLGKLESCVLEIINDIYTVNKELASEWNYKRNGKIMPSDIAIGSHRNNALGAANFNFPCLHIKVRPSGPL